MFNLATKTSDYLNLIVTHDCNKKCAFCIDQYVGEKTYISLDQVKKAIDFALKKQIKDILVIGGEPTLHPEIVEICQLIKAAGIQVIMTTNYTKPEVVRQLDGIVDCFNISFYYQKEIPRQKDFKSDITIHALIHKKQLQSKERLDRFIDQYQEHGHLKFSTLSNCNDFCEKNQSVPYLDDLPGDKIVLFDEMGGHIYRGCVIKRYDAVFNFDPSNQSYKAHVNGAIIQSWVRDAIN